MTAQLSMIDAGFTGQCVHGVVGDRGGRGGRGLGAGQTRTEGTACDVCLYVCYVLHKRMDDLWPICAAAVMSSRTHGV